MPLRKISTPLPCLHPEHYPPNNISLEPGQYEYTCPGCGHKMYFFVPGFVCSTGGYY